MEFVVIDRTLQPGQDVTATISVSGADRVAGSGINQMPNRLFEVYRAETLVNEHGFTYVIKPMKADQEGLEEAIAAFKNYFVTRDVMACTRAPQDLSATVTTAQGFIEEL